MAPRKQATFLAVTIIWSFCVSADPDVPFFMPRLATNLMGSGNPEAGSLESMDQLSQFPCYGNACDRLASSTGDGWDAGNPGAVGASGRRAKKSNDAPTAHERIPDPVVMSVSLPQTSMFADGEVKSVDSRPTRDNGAPDLASAFVMEDVDVASLPVAGTSAFPTALANPSTRNPLPSSDEPIFPDVADAPSGFPLSAEAARAAAARIQRERQLAALEAARRAYAPAPAAARRGAARGVARQDGGHAAAVPRRRQSVVGVELDAPAAEDDARAGRKLLFV